MALKLVVLFAVVAVVAGRYRNRAVYAKPKATGDKYLNKLACLEAKQDKMAANINTLVEVVKKGQLLELVFDMWTKQKNISENLNKLLTEMGPPAEYDEEYQQIIDGVTSSPIAGMLGDTDEILNDDLTDLQDEVTTRSPQISTGDPLYTSNGVTQSYDEPWP